MKPFLGIDLTDDKHNIQPNGRVFLVDKPSSASSQLYERSCEDAEETIERSKLPLLLRIAKWVCGCVGAVTAVAIARSLVGENSVTFTKAYENAGWVFWLSGICLLTWVILKVLSFRKEKEVLSAEESTQTFEKLSVAVDTVFSELSVPSDAKETDVLLFFYKIKNGDVKVCTKAMQIAPYYNPSFCVFADDQNLYLANAEGKYAFPLSEIRAIHTVKKAIRINEWHKEQPYNAEDYKQYKLTEDNNGCICCKYYHIMEVDRYGERWGMYFPCYELPVFEALTGLHAQQP